MLSSSHRCVCGGDKEVIWNVEGQWQPNVYAEVWKEAIKRVDQRNYQVRIAKVRCSDCGILYDKGSI